MKKRLLLLAIFALLSRLGASPLPSACGDLQFGLDGLYWQPLHCDFDYAVITFDTFVVSPQIGTGSVKSHYDWGFRVFADYKCNCSGLRLSYTRFHGGGSDCLMRGGRDTNNPMQVVGVAGTEVAGADALLNFHYQNVDLRMTQNVHMCRKSLIAVFANVRWVDLRQKERVKSLRRTSNDNYQASYFEQVSTFEGGALGVGLKAGYCVFDGVTFNGDINALGAIGRQRIPKNFSLVDNISVFRRESAHATGLIPAIEARGALRCERPCGCVTFVGEVGYQMVYYWHAFRTMVPILGSTNVGAFECFDIGFAGPYLQLQVRY